MNIKRFLASAVVLMGLGLPVRASIAVYCDSGCGATNTISDFNSIVVTNMLTYAYGVDQVFNGALAGGGTTYTDGPTEVAFADTNMFTITGSDGLETDGTHDTITISIPMTYSAVRISLLSGTTGSSFFTCLDASCDGTNLFSSTSTTVGYVNNAPGSPWTIQISATYASEQIIVNSFNAAGAGPANSDTPEVGTLLLIGSGLIAMRWMNRLPRLFFRTPPTVQSPA